MLWCSLVPRHSDPGMRLVVVVINPNILKMKTKWIFDIKKRSFWLIVTPCINIRYENSQNANF